MWEAELPALLRGQALWKVQAYRRATYVAHCAADDARRLTAFPTMKDVSEQLVRAAGSIAANIAEGYGRRSRADRVRYFEYALGSAGESQSWYLAARASLTPAVADERLDELNRVTRLLITMIKNERTRRSWSPEKPLNDHP